MVGIVGLGLAGLGWVIVDLSRCKLKEEKKGILGGVDVMIKVVISSQIQYLLYTQYSSESWSFRRGYCNCIVKDIKIFISSWFPSSSIRLGVLAACMLCSMLFSLVLIEYYLLSSFVVSLPHPL